jgi:hypothetical protein
MKAYKVVILKDDGSLVSYNTFFARSYCTIVYNPKNKNERKENFGPLACFKTKGDVEDFLVCEYRSRRPFSIRIFECNIKKSEDTYLWAYDPDTGKGDNWPPVWLSKGSILADCVTLKKDITDEFPVELCGVIE